MLISPSELVSLSVRFYRENWKSLWPYLILLFLPSVILQALGILAVYLYAMVPSLSVATEIVILLVLAATFVFDIWVSVAFVRAVKMLTLREPGASDWKSLFHSTSRLIWPVFAVSALFMLAVIFGMVLLIVPGFIFSMWYFFGYYAAAVDERFGLSALSFSKSLVVGRFWQIFVRLFVPSAIFGGLGFILRYIATSPIGLLPVGEFWTLMIQSVIATAISTLTAPLFYSTGLLLYMSAKSNPVDTNPLR